MKAYIKFTATILLLLLATAGNSIAFRFDQDYWTFTDLTTFQDGEATFVLTLEFASYESDFGLFTVDDHTNPTSINQKLQVFGKQDEPSFSPLTEQSVWFKQGGSGWEASIDNLTWTLFDDVFGFYFNVYTGGVNDNAIDYTWYTDIQFNDPASNVEYVATQRFDSNKVDIFLDDQLGGGDRDFNDMVVHGIDLKPFSVPEPATIILFGTGLLGLAGLARTIKK